MLEIKAGKVTEVKFERPLTVKDLYDHLEDAINEGHANLLVQTSMDDDWGVPVGFQARAPQLAENPMTTSAETWQERLAHSMLETATVGRFLLAGASDKEILPEGAQGRFNLEDFEPMPYEDWKQVEDILRFELNSAGLGHLIEETDAKSPRRLMVSRSR